MLRLLCVIVVFTFFMKYGTMIPIWNKTSTVSKCLIHTLNKYFATCKKLSIIFAQESRFWANEVLQNVHFPTVVNALEYRKESGLHKQRWSDVVLVFGEMIDINFVLNTTLWRANSVFLIAANSNNNLKSILGMFWSNKIVNVYVLMEDGAGDVTVHSFIPQGPMDCDVGNPVIVDKWKNDKFDIGNTVHNKEKIQNMNGCPVRISSVDRKPYTILEHNRSEVIDGIEIKILLEASRILNFTAWFHTPLDGKEWGRHKPPEGAIGEVYTGYSDFAIGALSPGFERYDNLDFSITYCPMECGTFVVPRGKRGQQDVWIRFLLSEFSDALWLCIFMSVITTATVLLVLIKFIGRRTVNYSIFHILSTVIGVPTRYPVFRDLKILYLLWAYVSLLFTSIYQSSLSSKLAAPTLDKDIETFEQLLQSDLKLVGIKGAYNILYHNRHERNCKRMLDRFVVSAETIESAIEVMTTKRDIAYVYGKSGFMHFSLLHEESRGAINVLTDCFYVYYPIIMMRKHSPYTKQVNKIINRLLNGGVIDHWMKSYIYDKSQHSDTVVKLTLAKLKGIFFFWMGGLMISVLALITEGLLYLASRYLSK